MNAKKEKPSHKMKRWMRAMARQGADVRTLTARQYALHLMLMGGGR